MGIVEELRKEKNFIEGSLTNLPAEGGLGDTLEGVYDRFLSEENARALSTLSQREIYLLSILDAYSMANDETDLEGFIRAFTQNLFLLSSSLEGKRAKALHDIAVGVMNKEYALELAQIRAGVGENQELKDVI